MSDNLQQARHDYQEAARKLAEAVFAEFPIGKRVEYTHASNQRPIDCEVQDHGYGGDVLICARQTGRLIWVRGGMDTRLVGSTI